MGLIYKPLGIVMSIIGGIVGRKVFDFILTKVDDEEPPKATTLETSWAKVIAVSALQGVIFRIARVVVARYGAIGWNYLTGTWPGETRPDPDD
jgi:hypothetical protein